MSVEWKNQALGISTDKLRLRWGGGGEWGKRERKQASTVWLNVRQ